MAADQAQGVGGDLADELLEVFVVSGPRLELIDQIHGHVDGLGLALLFEGQASAGLGATGTFNRAETALDEGADLGNASQSGVTPGGVAIGSDG